jgi:hypothetical protein
MMEWKGLMWERRGRRELKSITGLQRQDRRLKPRSEDECPRYHWILDRTVNSKLVVISRLTKMLPEPTSTSLRREDVEGDASAAYICTFTREVSGSDEFLRIFASWRSWFLPVCSCKAYILQNKPLFWAQRKSTSCFQIPQPDVSSPAGFLLEIISSPSST